MGLFQQCVCLLEQAQEQEEIKKDDMLSSQETEKRAKTEAKAAEAAREKAEEKDFAKHKEAEKMKRAVFDARDNVAKVKQILDNGEAKMNNMTYEVEVAKWEGRVANHTRFADVAYAIRRQVTAGTENATIIANKLISVRERVDAMRNDTQAADRLKA